ncbi:MAG: YqjD family protein [Alphaproteobacteria bacterium]
MATARSSADVIESYKSDVAQLRKQIRKLTDTVNDITADRGSELSDVLRANLQSVVSQGEEALSQVRDQAERVTAETQDAIAKNPLTAVSVALGVGVVLGMLCRGR